jgi:nucleotide-binding universal stress UspA family protein
VLEGDPASVIVDLAKSRHVSALVISTHGRTGLRHFFLGSVAERVLRHTTCPVLLVR